MHHGLPHHPKAQRRETCHPARHCHFSCPAVNNIFNMCACYCLPSCTHLHSHSRTLSAERYRFSPVLQWPVVQQQLLPSATRVHLSKVFILCQEVVVCFPTITTLSDQLTASFPKITAAILLFLTSTKPIHYLGHIIPDGVDWSPNDLSAVQARESGEKGAISPLFSL